MSSGAEVGLAVAFIAGLISFLSPCVAPLVPGYLSLISGSTAHEAAQSSSSIDWRLVRTAFAFVAGFALVFITLGASAATLGNLLEVHRTSLIRISGGFMILMGLVMLGVFQLPWLLRERRWHREPRQFTSSESLLLGMAFGFGWTPCFGPILAVILAYASTVETVRQGTALLTAYTAGLGFPFLLIGFGVGSVHGLGRMVRRWNGLLSAGSGAVLVILGGLFITNQFFFVTIATQRLYYTVVGG